jgi:hypothetical protein
MLFKRGSILLGSSTSPAAINALSNNWAATSSPRALRSAFPSTHEIVYNFLMIGCLALTSSTAGGSSLAFPEFDCSYIKINKRTLLIKQRFQITTYNYTFAYHHPKHSSHGTAFMICYYCRAVGKSIGDLYITYSTT